MPPAAGLAAVPGIAGLHVAHKWLADLLVYLSKDATAYSAVKVVSLLEGCRWLNPCPACQCQLHCPVKSVMGQHLSSPSPCPVVTKPLVTRHLLWNASC